MSGYSVLAYQRTPNASNADLLDLGTFDTR